MPYKKLVIESLNELRNFEQTKDPLDSLDIGLQRIKTIRLTFYKNSSIYLISYINKNDIRWSNIVNDLGHMKENVLDYIKNKIMCTYDVIIEYLDKNDNEIDNDFYKNLNESYHFEKKKDPLDSLDIGLNHINKIKSIEYRVYDENQWQITKVKGYREKGDKRTDDKIIIDSIKTAIIILQNEQNKNKKAGYKSYFTIMIDYSDKNRDIVPINDTINISFIDSLHYDIYINKEFIEIDEI